MNFFYTLLAFIQTFVVLNGVSALRFDLTNVTCSRLRGPRCGTYLLRVAGTNATFLGQKYLVGFEALTQPKEDFLKRYLENEPRLIPRLTTVAENQTDSFHPFFFTTNQASCNPQSIESDLIPFVNTVTNEIQYDSWAYTMLNASLINGLANQLMNASTYGVQVATCLPGFTNGYFDAPTVNIFNNDEEVPSWCTAIEFEAVCPLDVGFN
ncbi:hypothetical protein SJAG_00161 [Schizosaccharomyces japonicus yFS275]|uniref:Uncharacterized protein n=1 Tax=Schizosaccharomyces japonicus (strain yFS275 / FY16936) TaxID=402676 RepID=B6JXM1_SCHJY|nr:hypothetical protein SJAG_00161 [Schizosaccharomyces japonicus yFS275]EEB05165.1 hypothetical protein SJAG_00161 [Schizosaccharomyces japonicus yFS275]